MYATYINKWRDCLFLKPDKESHQSSKKALPKEPENFAIVIQGNAPEASTPQSQTSEDSGMPLGTRPPQVKKTLAFEKIGKSY